ncbi:MarR family winged helix-turn-helix transcriptional regulator [Hydrogenophaga sp. BPS33]|uniref:MarR family winged helix-turn-helix transcriptional regulator n=1 Tax=Hydrogenophaga sp. BPS33 TaxID=2651974 RepID=UPI00131F7EC4|nr:MarR family winged helix-turn-helix transcriptional regulator [Hydrogenophaga sp. BPS33]QHE85583.1 winged helix-turn-helix transcriptional regulator [Hydrogenophaga sp. BPS33]
MPQHSTANALRRTGVPRKAVSGRSHAHDASLDGLSESHGIDTSFLESLLGYNARRAALAVIAVFLRRMAPYGVRPVDFSVLSVVAYNPGVTSRQICATLDILPPNLVGMIKSLQKRGLVVRKPHPNDRRAQGLHLSDEGQTLYNNAQATASSLERDVAGRLTPDELDTLITLLRKVYR